MPPAAQLRPSSAFADPDDTGQNAPEAPETLVAQLRAVREGRQRVAMFPKGTPELPLADGLARVETPRGVFHYDPKQIEAADIVLASEARRENEVLGLGPASKADVLARARDGEPVAALVERQPDGVEVKGAVVTPSTLPATAEEMSARAEPGNRLRLEPVASGLAARQQPTPATHELRGMARLRAIVEGMDAEGQAPGTVEGLVNTGKRGLRQAEQSVYGGVIGMASGLADDADREPERVAAERAGDHKPTREQIAKVWGDGPAADRAFANALRKWEEREQFREERLVNNARYAEGVRRSLIPANAGAIGRLEAEIQSLPQSEPMQDWERAESIGQALAVLARDPVEVVSNLALGGMTSGAPSLAAGLLGGAAAGPVGAAAATGAGTLATEYGAKIVDELKAAGVDFNQPETLAVLVGDEARFATIRNKALLRGVPVAVFDAVSAGIAGKLVTSPARSIVGKVAQGVGELAVQASLGGAGEAAGSLAAGDEVSGKAVLEEVLSSAGPGAVEVAAGAARHRHASGEAAPLHGMARLRAMLADADAQPEARMENTPAAAPAAEPAPAREPRGMAGLRSLLDQAEPDADPDGKTPLGSPAELVADQIDARPVEDFRADLAGGLTGPDVDLVSQVTRWGELSRPDRADPAAVPEAFEDFASRAEARFGPRVGAYLAPAWDAIAGGERVGDLNEAASNPLALENTARRALTYGRLFWEGSADVLRRSGLRSLASAVEQHVDATDRNLAFAWAPFRAALAPFKGVRGLLRRGEFAQARAEFEAFQLAREEGRADDAAQILAQASPAARDLVAATAEAMARTGYQNRRLGVRVRDASGNIRPIGELGAKYFPRVVRSDVADVLRDPSTNPERWRQMQDELLAAGLIRERAEAAEYLRRATPDDADTLSRGDSFAPLAVARGARLPSSWLRHDFGVVAEYLARWAERAAQIEAFGQKIGPDDLDAFDYAQRATNNYALADYVAKTRAAAYRLTRVPRKVRAALGNVTAATTGLLMGNPYSTARNLIGGVAQTVNQFGPIRAFAELREAFRAASHADAEAVGALKADVADLLFHGEGSASVRGLAGLTLRVNGFNAAENFVRTHGMLTARAFLRDALALRRERPRSRRALQATAFLQRHGLNLDKLDAEAGRGPETDRFLRGAVRQSQGGYRYDQTPLFTQTPVGRLLFQMQRWGTQATRFHVKHVLAPALVGDLVTVRNPDGSASRRRVRTLAPLLRSPLVAMAAGVSTYSLREAAFGIARTDQTWDEVFEALSEDEQRGVELALGRMTNDLVMGGTFGAVSSFADTLRWAVKQGEVRSPVEPPSISLALEVVALARKADAQGGQLSAQDLREFAGRMVTAYKYHSSLAYSIADKVGAEWEAARRHRAEQDRRFARGVGRRFAEARGLPSPEAPPSGVPGFSRRAPLYDALEDALHEGDAESVRTVVGEALDDIRTEAMRAKVRTRLRDAALRRAPMNPGGRQDHATREDFRDWMRDHLSDADRERVEAAQRRFIVTAVRGGLLREADLDRYADGLDLEDDAE